MANDDRDQRRDRPLPPSIGAQIARADRARSGTPVHGTPIDQMAHRIKRASDQTLPDIQQRVSGLEVGHVTMIRDIGEVKGAIGILGTSIGALIKSADNEAAEQAKDREAARAERAARAARAATAAEASKERLSRRQLAAIAIVPAILTALAAFLAVILK